MKSKRFAFGKNWKDYIASQYSEDTYKNAEDSLLKFLNKNDLEGKTFLDVGCGSGIHSLVAARAGAVVTGIDYDVDSVECSRKLSEEKGEGADWKVSQGSLLDAELMNSLGKFDVVYCWGVAHHTGDMWKALENLVPSVKEGGLLFIAIYNTVPGRLGSKYWLKVKKVYVSLPRFLQVVMEWLYFLGHIIRMLLTLKNPFKVMRNYKQKRGMSYRHDLNDWLGGYPYEYAKTEELFDFYAKQGFKLVKLTTTTHIGNNQLLFRREAS